MKKTFIVHNPTSGKSRCLAELSRRFPEIQAATVRETESATEASRVTVQAASDGFDLIVAAGGDGTVNSVANGIVASGSQVPMAVLPLGTANDFAATLAIPDAPEEAVGLWESGTVRQLDLVELETPKQKCFFANVAAGGNSDRVTSELTDEIKRTWGMFSYLRGAIGVLSDLESYTAKITLDDNEPLDECLWNVLVANGRTNGGRLPVAPRANPEDGLLDVILIRDGEVADLAQLAARFALSDYLNAEQVLYRRAKSLRISSSPAMRFSIDGEPVAGEPIDFRVKPQAIRMIVGSEYSPASEATHSAAVDELTDRVGGESAVLDHTGRDLPKPAVWPRTHMHESNESD